MTSPYSATDPAVGYLYQVRVALLLLLEADYDGEVSIEVIDDVAFEKGGSAAELLQLKHHFKQAGSLSNSSTDLWKTIRIWSSALRSKTLTLPTTMLTLMTTSVAPSESAAYYLRNDPNRNPKHALEKLLAVCDTSVSQDNKKAYDEFLSLTVQQQQDLLNAIHVLDNAPNILDVHSAIRRRLRLSVRAKQIDSLVQRLEGWWNDRVIRHLTDVNHSRIRFDELQSQIADFAEQMKPDALPADFGTLKAAPTAAAMDDWRFVAQIRLIGHGDRRVEDAKRDYYRAFEQRSKWARELLISESELIRYEGRLTEEWDRRYYDACESLVGDESEEQLQAIGQKIYRWMELDANIPIRPNFLDLYLMRGSYHMLADEPTPRVGWHPRFSSRLSTPSGEEVEVAAP